MVQLKHKYYLKLMGLIYNVSYLMLRGGIFYRISEFNFTEVSFESGIKLKIKSKKERGLLKC